MVDTVRTLTALQTLLADNALGNVDAQEIRDFLVSVYPTFSGARVYNDAQLSDLASPSDLTFNQERFDTDSYHSTSTNTERLTVPSAGKYSIGCTVRFTAAGNGDYRSVFIRKDGATNIATSSRVYNADAGGMNISFSTIYDFAAAEYVELRVSHDSAGADVDVTVSANTSPEFWIYRLDESGA